MKKILIIISVLFTCFCVYKVYTKVTIINLPEGELKWSNAKPKSAKLCVPAAFSSVSNKVVGIYKINGVSYGNDRKYKVSILDDTFIINRSWKSDNGFQQVILLKDHNVFNLGNSKKKAIRRALCKDENKTFIIESNYPMTMSEFAQHCSKHCSNAIYLDMGEYGYGYVKRGYIKYPLFLAGVFTKHKQTNWLYIE